MQQTDSSTQISQNEISELFERVNKPNNITSIRFCDEKNASPNNNDEVL